MAFSSKAKGLDESELQRVKNEEETQKEEQWVRGPAGRGGVLASKHIIFTPIYLYRLANP